MRNRKGWTKKTYAKKTNLKTFIGSVPKYINTEEGVEGAEGIKVINPREEHQRFLLSVWEKEKPRETFELFKEWIKTKEGERWLFSKIAA